MAVFVGTKPLHTDRRAPSEGPTPYWAASGVPWIAKHLYRTWIGSLT